MTRSPPTARAARWSSDHIIPFSERHIRRGLHEYVTDYDEVVRIEPSTWNRRKVRVRASGPGRP